MSFLPLLKEYGSYPIEILSRETIPRYPFLVMELTRHRDVRSFRRYPNRKNKIAAKRAFLKAVKKLD
jgi:hypothetical protein